MMNKRQLTEITTILDQLSGGDGIHATIIPGVNCIKLSCPSARLPSVYKPCVCFIIQGRKQVFLEEEIYVYGPSEYLAVSVDLPLIGEVTEASKGEPYFCLQLELDQQVLAELLVLAPISLEAKSIARRGIFVGTSNNVLSECVLRLVRLLEAPQDVPLLAPLVKRELYYRLLTGEYGDVIAQMVRAGSHMHRIALAIKELKSNFNKPVKVEDLASHVGMSVSSFHAHFKLVTAMSPLQYQKRLRLLEARQIMLVEMQDTVSTAYRVGYESPSQFSREYARMFGNPPGRDINRLVSAKASADLNLSV